MATTTSFPTDPENNLPFVTENTLSEKDQIIAVANYELEQLAKEIPEMQKFRNYFDGEQKLAFGTQKFKDAFGDAFKDFKDNWCAVVVEAPLNKMSMTGLVFPPGVGQGAGSSGGEGGSTGESTGESTADSSLQPLADLIWHSFQENDIDEQQQLLFEGALVEGRSAMLVWPDPELGVRIDWQPGELIRVRYSEEDWRKPVLAVKRWLTPSGILRVNVYTHRWVYKFYQQSIEVTDSKTRDRQMIPGSGPSGNLIEYRVQGEEWPLPNPLGEIPIVEFFNRRGSELKNVIPLQDAVNYMIMSSFVGAEFQAFPQRVFLSGAKEPDGGWSNSPGKVWKLPPTYDTDGKPHYGQMGEFSPAQLGEFRSLTEMLLQHVALTSKTPVRMFFKSDRGGRGDAPSGESLLIEDEPLIDKVASLEKRFGNSMYRVARLVAKALRISGRTNGIEIPTRLPYGEVQWEDPRSKYRAALLEEGKLMSEIGFPVEFIATQVGLPPEQVKILKDMLEKQKADQEKLQREQVEAMRESQGNGESPNGSPNGVPGSSPSPSSRGSAASPSSSSE